MNALQAVYRFLYIVSSLLLSLGFVLGAAKPAGAEEVKAQFRDLTVNANLELAKGKTIADGIILITHQRLQHYGREILRTLQQLLKERGYSSIAINYSFGLNDRRGPYDCAIPHRHTIDGNLEEIGFWVEWLKSKGAKSIVLSGHSAGANDIARFAGEYKNPAITKIVMITPGTAALNHRSPAGYRARYKKELSDVLAQANKLIEAGRGNEIMEKTDFLFCPAAPVSAITFVSYYGPGTALRLLPKLLQRLPVPTLIIAAGEDNVAPDMKGLVTPHVDGKRIKLVTIEGATHFLRDFYLQDAVDAIVAFLADK